MTAGGFLESCDVPAHKVSFELVDLPYCEKSPPRKTDHRFDRHDEIEEAVATIQSQGNKQLALLKCTVRIPPRLKWICGLCRSFKRFGLPVGLSDLLWDTLYPWLPWLWGDHCEKRYTFARRTGPRFRLLDGTGGIGDMVQAIRNGKVLRQGELQVSPKKAKAECFVQPVRGGRREAAHSS